ncbi:hypothetical protein [Chryseobacterium aquifrigidense]|uniref:Uncharacterized protein n=1 Tax=Chryseobacterium aquifrigidense TaxID=558021 RepID=A0A543E9R6_9FLAO|nr:hypothetical protein [Chryseobacterium aquifrigidense]TQM18327.1 hypothetical protein FB551_4108 [Chryseobacterium aquifrigidense]
MEPAEFIKKKVNHKYILDARQQQKDLSYFIQGSLQEEITIEYLRVWSNRKYASDNKFLNWVKLVFKTENFLSFYKYLRNPVASAKLVNDDIKPQLRRVFHADDSVFKYSVKGIEETCHADLNSKQFDEELFNAILFDHNSVVVQDIDIESKRYREIVPISKIVSVDCDRDQINKIAYYSCLELENSSIHGFSYIDKDQYIFFDRDYNIIVQSFHDLGVCPADWVSSENMFQENNVVKKSIFSYALPDFEEYVFLKTLQRMTEPNGAIPVTVQLNAKETNPSGELRKGLSKEPMSSAILGAQTSDDTNPIAPSESDIQAGSIVKVKASKDVTSGKVDMDVVRNYFQFHYMPVEALNYLNERIKEIEKMILSSMIGDIAEQNEAAKNEMQVSKGYDSKEDRLRWLSNELSRIKQLSDFKTLALLHGKDKVSVEVFFGTDFFIESVDDLYKSFSLAPNAIERRKILKRISQTRNKHNLQQAKRDTILYDIIPYVSDKDFSTAMSTEAQVDPVVFQLQTRFDYWISIFEAEYGQIELFYEGLGEMTESTKMITIKNLLKNIIQNEQKSFSNA